MTRILLLVAGLLAALPVRADALAEQIVKRLAGYPVVRAQFEQLRQSASLPKPALSSGRMVAARKEGILWRIEKPLQLSIAFGAQTIIETSPDGTRRVVAQRRGAVQAEMGRIMRGILSGDLAQLRSTFQVQAAGTPDQWTLRLAPKTREMARFLEAVELGGAKFLESIEIAETSGDRTSIRMRDFAVAAALEPAELSQFSPP